MGVETNPTTECLSGKSTAARLCNNPSTTATTVPAVGIYRPPAMRKAMQLDNNATSSVTAATTTAGGNGKRLLLPENLTEATVSTESSNLLPVVHNSSTDDADSKSGNSIQRRVKTEEKSFKVQSENNATINNNNSSSRIVTTVAPRQRERRPDRAVYIPRARRSQTTPPAAVTSIGFNLPVTAVQSLNPNLIDSGPIAESTPEQQSLSSHCRDTISTVITNSENNVTDAFEEIPKNSFVENISCDFATNVKPTPKNNSLQSDNSFVTKISSSSLSSTPTSCYESDSSVITTISTSSKINQMNKMNNKISQGNTQEINDGKKVKMMSSSMLPLRIEDSFLTTATVGGPAKEPDEKANKEDKDEKEFRKASQEINRSNRRIIKQTFNSDVLEIQEPITSTMKVNSQQYPENHKKPQQLRKTVNPEEDDWETMFDENGDCLDPKLMSELTAAVGKVSIERPKTDYRLYQSKQDLLNEEEFPHVLEVSNFPVEFKTQDLMMVFSAYKESGFDIKWVDDTHALAVFSSSKIAAEILASGHPFVLLKPLAEATAESRNKAKKCSNSLQPYRPRPETCAALARRLVTGALGVRLKTTREELENERRVLREAKERKLLAAKQRDEVWES